LDTCLPAGREHLKRMFTVYAIRSEVDGRIYVGFSVDIERRLKEHNSGKTKSTKGFRPWKIFYSENCIDRKSARIREVYLKSGIGKEFLKRL
jgi:putative endonuclease